MLFERRAYTLRPGTLDTFWGLQRKWNTPTNFRPLLERNIGYFSTTAGPAERIVHLYRRDSYDQAKRHLAAIVTPERMDSTGPLHRVVQYRWYGTRRCRRRMIIDARWPSVRGGVRSPTRTGPLVTESHTALLKPSPVPWMRSLFAPTDWPACSSGKSAIPHERDRRSCCRATWILSAGHVERWDNKKPTNDE
jgi:hypothetical protein